MVSFGVMISEPGGVQNILGSSRHSFEKSMEIYQPHPLGPMCDQEYSLTIDFAALYVTEVQIVQQVIVIIRKRVGAFPGAMPRKSSQFQGLPCFKGTKGLTVVLLLSSPPSKMV